MSIEFIENLKPDANSYYNHETHNIKLNVNDEGGWEMTLCHEIGHFLDDNVTPHLDIFDITSFRKELKAWRIAKSIIKPELWNEKEALRIMKLWERAVRWPDGCFYKNYINWDKFKIIPLNKGLKFTKLNGENK